MKHNIKTNAKACHSVCTVHKIEHIKESLNVTIKFIANFFKTLLGTIYFLECFCFAINGSGTNLC